MDRKRAGKSKGIKRQHLYVEKRTMDFFPGLTGTTVNSTSSEMCSWLSSRTSLKWKNILASRSTHLMKPKPSRIAAITPYRTERAVNTAEMLSTLHVVWRICWDWMGCVSSRAALVLILVFSSVIIWTYQDWAKAALKLLHWVLWFYFWVNRD